MSSPDAGVQRRNVSRGHIKEDETDRRKGSAMTSTAPLLVQGELPSKASSHRRLMQCVLATLHFSALILMAATEADPLDKAIFLLVWGVLNSIWLVLVRRPSVAALLSLVLLVLLSRFKHDKLWMTVDFVDLMIIDRDTSAFLLAAFPSLRGWVAVIAAITAALLVTAWRLGVLRLERRGRLVCGFLCMALLVALSLWFPTDLSEDFLSRNYVSKFARTGVEAIHEFAAHGFLQADASEAVSGSLTAVPSCQPSRKLPHIILLHDESSFDITVAPGVKVPAGYRDHFKSFDGKSRKFLVEGVGGPSWFTEYNVLAGLSARSYGRFATSVTRIAAGRVNRGLPQSLSRCGYKTFSLYPFYGAFLDSRAFQTATGIAHYLDMVDLGTRDFEPDRFYFDRAAQLIQRERGNGPLFVYVYTVANHFPWDKRLRPELTPDWRDLGNAPDVDEYIRRQGMTAHDYSEFLKRLEQVFPGESFLIVRYGDHQPQFGPRIIDPSLDAEARSRGLEPADTRYLKTYYAIDAVNFTPADLSSALDTLDAPYLPLVVQQAAGVPLGPGFSEQKKILQRCEGLFYGCAGGAEASRFNRLLIQAGWLRGF